MLWGDILLDGLTLVTQALESNHLVGFIKDEDPDHLGVKDISPRDHIDDGSRGSNEDVSVDFDTPFP
jgi:hypothetical protein